MARFEEHVRDFTYRIYIAKGMKYLAGLNVDYHDIIATNVPQVNSEDVKSRIKDGLRKVRGE